MGVIATPVPTKKRKAVAAADADAASPPSAAGFTNKRVMKKNQKPKSPGAQLVDTVLSSAYHVPQDKAEYKKQITELAEYARSLEESIKNGGKPVLSAIGRKQAASDLKHKIARDIEKAMKVCENTSIKTYPFPISQIVWPVDLLTSLQMQIVDSIL